MVIVDKLFVWYNNKKETFKIKKIHMMKKTKKTIIASVCSLSILFFPAFALAATAYVVTNTFGLPAGSILDIVDNISYWLLSIFAVVGIIGFVIAGIIYLVSTGDDDMVTRAKAAMRWSIVGIIVGLSGLVIMQAVLMMLSGSSDTF